MKNKIVQRSKIVLGGSILIASLLSAFLNLSFAQDTKAMRSNDEIMKLSLLQGMERCYLEGDFIKPIINNKDLYEKGAVAVANTVRLDDLYYEQAMKSNDKSSRYNANRPVLLPTGVANTIPGTGRTDCLRVFTGDKKGHGDNGEHPGLKSYYTINNYANYYGYTPEYGTPEVGYQYKLNSIYDKSGLNSKPLVINDKKLWCTKIDGRVAECYGALGFDLKYADGDLVYDETAEVDPMLKELLGKDPFTIRAVASVKTAIESNFHYIFSSDALTGESALADALSAIDSANRALVDGNTPSPDAPTAGEITLDNYVPYLNRGVRPCNSSEVCLAWAGEFIKLYFNLIASSIYSQPAVNFMAEKVDSKELAGSSYALVLGTDKKAAYKSAVKVFAKDDYENLSWDNSLTYALYVKYINMAASRNYGKLNFTCAKERNPAAAYSFKNKPDQWCTINIEDVAILKQPYNVVSAEKKLKVGFLEDALNWLNKPANYAGLKDSDYQHALVNADGTLDSTIVVPPVDTEEDSADVVESDDEKAKSACFDNSGPLGWLLCPIVSSAQLAMDAIYHYVEEHFLQLPLTEFLGGDDSPVKAVWSKFRDVANILFVVCFLAVILSQISGIGISNYGIKKILPKLIVSAILVNFSFIICQVLLDISNIAGVAIDDMLMSFTGLSPAKKSAMRNGLSMGVAIGVDGVLTVAGIGLAVYLNPSLLLIFVMSVLSGLLSLLFLWFLLNLRMVCVVLCVALSPVAFVFAMLPNTQSIFKKWMSIFKAMLFLYPICAMTVSSGILVASILAKIGSTVGDASVVFNLSAMLVRVLPYFAIPGLLNKTMNVAGGLADKINGVNKWAHGQTLGRIENSEAYKHKMKQLAAGTKNDGSLSKWRQGVVKAGSKLMNADGSKDKGRFSKIRYGAMHAVGGILTGGAGQRAARSSYNSEMIQENKNRLYGDPEYIEAQQALAMQQIQDDKVKGFEAMYGDRDMNTLRQKLTGAIVSGDEALVKACENLLVAMGDDGVEAARMAVAEAEKRARTEPIDVEAYQRGKKAWAHNMVQRHAKEVKKSSKSTFKMAQDIDAGADTSKAINPAPDSGVVFDRPSINGMSPKAIVESSENEIERIFKDNFTENYAKGIHYAPVNPEEADAMTDSIFSNKQITGAAKPKNLQIIAESFASRYSNASVSRIAEGENRGKYQVTLSKNKGTAVISKGTYTYLKDRGFVIVDDDNELKMKDSSQQSQ